MKAGGLPRALRWNGIAGILGCAILLALAAQVRVPVIGTPVPATLQLMAVLLTGYLLRPGPAAGAVWLYLAAGAIGFPVFAAGSRGLWGVTGGYLVGFPIAAWLISVLRGDARTSFARLLGAGAAGTFVIFALGILWSMVFFNVELIPALRVGFAPFAIKTIVELFLIAGLATKIHKRGRVDTRCSAP